MAFSQFDSTCRLCLTNKTKGYGVFSFQINETIQEKFEDFTREKLLMTPSRPKLICLDCKNKLEYSLFFRNMILESQTRLNEMFPHENMFTVKREIAFIDEASVTVKLEPVEEVQFVDSFMDSMEKDAEETPKEKNKNTRTSRKSTRNRINRSYREDSPAPAAETSDSLSKRKRKSATKPPPSDDTVKVEVKEGSREASPASFSNFDDNRDNFSSDDDYSKPSKDDLEDFKPEVKKPAKPEVLTTCSICLPTKKVQLQDEEDVKIHNEYVHEDPQNPFLGPYKCKTCSKVIASEVKMRKHVRLFHVFGNEKLCTTCGKKFYDRRAFYCHIDKNHGIRNVTCPVEGCGKMFNGKMNLGKHIKTHLPDGQRKIHICDRCGSRYINKDNLKLHFTKCDGKTFRDHTLIKPRRKLNRLKCYLNLGFTPTDPVSMEFLTINSSDIEAAPNRIEHPHGSPVNVVSFDDSRNIQVNESFLEQTFSHPEIKDRYVVVFSIIGAFRKGKSFFLDYCLRYLYGNYKSINFPSNTLDNKENWMGRADEPLLGFSWRSGIARDTTGIIMWDDVFLHTDDRGDKLAIVVMDTQGLFDNETTAADNSRIFALGTLISSIQVLNLSTIIQEDQLQYLHFATEFAKFAALNSDGEAGKPFQNLLFLIRDFADNPDYPFGCEGGEKCLKKILEVKPNQHEELQQVRKIIKSLFEELNCCLLPHPGKTMIRKSDFDGRWSLMDEDFKVELSKIIEKLLRPANLTPKKINGKNLTGAELKNLLSLYFKSFQSEEMPEPKSIVESIVEMQMNNLIAKSVDVYKKNINENREKFEKENLQIFHEMYKDKALTIFKNEKKMGNLEHEQMYEENLSDDIEKIYEEWKDQNEEHLKVIQSTIKEKMQMEKKLENEREKHEKEKRELKMSRIETFVTLLIGNLITPLLGMGLNYMLASKKMSLIKEVNNVNRSQKVWNAFFNSLTPFGGMALAFLGKFALSSFGLI